MNKVIRIYRDHNLYNGITYNNLFRIDNELAIAKGLSILNYFPKRKELRKRIIARCNQKAGIPFKVSHRDIKRLEKASKCEISINSAYILEAIIEEILEVKKNYRYRAPEADEMLVYEYMLNSSIVLLRGLLAKIDGELFDNEEEKEACQKFTQELNSLMADLGRLGTKYPFIFNALFA